MLRKRAGIAFYFKASTGIFRYPIAEATKIAFHKYAELASKLHHERTIRMAL
ncbi:hypothetical protein [Cecembia rubra]|uniref:hypothetical protein n=1 Tax=Cecembia rubra TaxID=1485585 RepID=UPI002714E958|nr:hypothetical protein [Cecembia rubra]